MVITLEDYAFQYGENLKNNPNASANLTFQNVQLYVKYIKQGGNLSGEERLFKFPDTSFKLSSNALSNTSGTEIVVMWYKTLHSFMTNTSLTVTHTNTDINNEIVIASVRPKPPEEFKEPVRITWKSPELVIQVTLLLFLKLLRRIGSHICRYCQNVFFKATFLYVLT